ncbi:MAG TPA: hypothetical protein VEC36_11015, partial [Patescibacteria group bacterium]|nr:hypothetical protein [Patescibacteria group bacterium]
TGGEKIVGTVDKKISWFGFTGPVKLEFSPNNGDYWKEIGSGIEGTSYAWPVPNTPTINARIRVTSLNDASKVKVSNTFSILPRTKGSILQETGVSFIPYGLAYDGRDGLWVTSFQSQYIYKLNSRTLKIQKEIKVPDVDSLCTDLTLDTERGLIYIHKLNSTTTSDGGVIITIDTNGTLIRRYKSPASTYPIGLALVDGKLICGDRDGVRRLYTVNPETGAVEAQVNNPSQQYFGPRGLAYDGSKYLYQVITAFPAGGGALTNAYVVRIDKNNLGVAVDTIVLSSTAGDVVNARGVSYNPGMDDIWVTSYDGSIFKVATADADIVAGVDDVAFQQSPLKVMVTPNPLSDFAAVSFSTLKNSHVKFTISDALGKQIATLFDGVVESGATQTLRFESNNLPAGVYTGIFVIDGRERMTQKLVIIK